MLLGVITSSIFLSCRKLPRIFDVIKEQKAGVSLLTSMKLRASIK